MAKRFRQPPSAHVLQQTLLELLPADHVVHFINDVVQSLDLKPIMDSYRSLAGNPPYDPTMMVKIWLYAYCDGIRSSRRVERAMRENIAFRILSNNQHPSHWTLNEFRKRHREALADLFYQTVQLAQRLDLVTLVSVAIDGTKIKANASKHSAMSYGRMTDEEARLKALIENYLNDCDQADNDEEQTGGGGGGRANQLPTDLATKKKRLEAIQAARKALEDEARESARAEQEERRKKAHEEGRDFVARKRPEAAVPDSKAQRNFTDPESRIMKGSGGEFVQAYNAQAAVDSAHQIIVAADLSNQSADAGANAIYG